MILSSAFCQLLTILSYLFATACLSSFMSHKLHIAYVLQGFCADKDDPCIPVITTFVKEMSKQAELTVYTGEYPFRFGEYRVHGVRVRCTGATHMTPRKKLNAWNQVRQLIAADHRTQPFDIVHAFWGTLPGYIGTLTGKQIGVPSIVSLAGGELARYPEQGYGSQLSLRNKWLVRRALAKATCITAGSTWLAEKVPAQHKEKLRTIPLGVDLEGFPPGTLRTGKRLLIVAAMIPIKDYSTMLRAVAIARKTFPDITVTAAGWMENTEEWKRIQQLTGQLGLQDAVNFAGEIAHGAMSGLYHTHDLLLHSSHYEAQGMAILEALATGMPVVSSNVGIVPGLPKDLVYRFTPGNPAEMAAQIVDSLSTAIHAEQAINHGPNLIQSHFNASNVANRFVELYGEVVG